MKHPLVYIVILNWNGYKDTIECIQSLKKIKYKNYKIIIVDNGSNDESVKILRSLFPKDKLLESRHNLGFAGGCNVGIKFALRNKADYILLLNNDTIVQKKFLDGLIHTILTYPNAGIVSPVIYYKNNKDVISSSGGFKNYGGPYPFIDPLYNLKKGNFLRQPQERDCVTGCCMLINKNVFKKIGLFDEKYFLYAEDTDFCLRAKEANFKVVVDQSQKIFHTVSASSGGPGNKRKVYYDTRNVIILGTKHLNGLSKYNYLFSFLKGRIYEIIIFVKNNKYSHAYAVLFGVLDGFRNRAGQNNNF